MNRICLRDGREFETLQDLLVHQSLDHDHSKRRLRNVSCHRCASEIDVNVTDSCQNCGFVLPREKKEK